MDIAQAENKTKATWNVINQNRNTKSKTKEPVVLNLNDKIVNDPEEVSTEFNNYYINLPKNILKDQEPYRIIFFLKQIKVLFF